VGSTPTISTINTLVFKPVCFFIYTQEQIVIYKTLFESEYSNKLSESSLKLKEYLAKNCTRIKQKKYKGGDKYGNNK